MNKHEITNLINDFKKLENYQHMKQYQKLTSILKNFNYLDEQIKSFNINNAGANIRLYLNHTTLLLNIDNFSVTYNLQNKQFYINSMITTNINSISLGFNLFQEFIEINQLHLQNSINDFNIFNSIYAAYQSIINKDKDQKVALHRKYLKDIIINFKKSYHLDTTQPILRIELRFYKYNNTFSFLTSNLLSHDKEKYTQEIENYLNNPSNILINGEYNNNSLNDIKQLIPFMNSLPLTKQDNSFNIDIALLDDFISTSNKLSNF